jgi:hypothetical protein
MSIARCEDTRGSFGRLKPGTVLLHKRKCSITFPTEATSRSKTRRQISDSWLKGLSGGCDREPEGGWSYLQRRAGFKRGDEAAPDGNASVDRPQVPAYVFLPVSSRDLPLRKTVLKILRVQAADASPAGHSKFLNEALLL